MIPVSVFEVEPASPGNHGSGRVYSGSPTEQVPYLEASCYFTMLHYYQCCHSAYTARETRQLAQQQHKLAFLHTASLVVGYTLRSQRNKRFVRSGSDPSSTSTGLGPPPCYFHVHHVLDLLLIRLASDWRCALTRWWVQPRQNRTGKDGMAGSPDAQADGPFSILRDKRLEIWSVLSFPWLHKVPPVCLHQKRGTSDSTNLAQQPSSTAGSRVPAQTLFLLKQYTLVNDYHVYSFTEGEVEGMYSTVLTHGSLSVKGGMVSWIQMLGMPDL